MRNYLAKRPITYIHGWEIFRSNSNLALPAARVLGAVRPEPVVSAHGNDR